MCSKGNGRGEKTGLESSGCGRSLPPAAGAHNSMSILPRPLRELCLFGWHCPSSLHRCSWKVLLSDTCLCVEDLTVGASHPALVTLIWKSFSALTPSFGFSGHVASVGTSSTALTKEVPTLHLGARGLPWQESVRLMHSPTASRTHQVGEGMDEMSDICGSLVVFTALLAEALMGPPTCSLSVPSPLSNAPAEAVPSHYL